MPDWRSYVQAHLRFASTLDVDSKDVVRELATHLEDTYTALRADGVAEEDAVRQAYEQAGNWEKLSDDIIKIKREGDMQNRVSQLWVPGLVTLLGSAGLLALLEILGVRPIVFRAGSPSAIVLYLPWLLTLPVFGALGAFLSRRAQARGLAVHVSSAFPAVVMAVVMVMIFIGALFFDQPVSMQLKTIGLSAGVLTWIALPGVALLLGDLFVGWGATKRGVPPQA